jgi:hypothetical protein
MPPPKEASHEASTQASVVRYVPATCFSLHPYLTNCDMFELVLVLERIIKEEQRGELLQGVASRR